MNITELQQTFGEVYDAYVDKIYRFCYIKVSSTEIAEDLTAETFTRGWKAFQKNHEEGRDIEHVSGFLYQTARNLVVDFYRSRHKEPVMTTEEIIIVDEENSALEQVYRETDMALILRAVRQLRPDYQDLVIWHYVDDFTVPEIAQIMQKPQGAVRTQLSRALKRLKQEVQAAEPRLVEKV